MNFVKLYIGDYQRDTGHLSIAEHGAYLLMLQHYYATERPLPTGKALHRLLRAETKTERDAIDSVVRQFWAESARGLVNGRADEEIRKAEHQRAVNREVGKLGGRRPKTDSETDSVMRSLTDSVMRSETDSVMRSLTDSKPNENPNQTPDTRQKNSRAPTRKTPLPAGFTASDQVRQWFAGKGYRESLQRHVENFVEAARARGYTYVDWDAALRKAISDDWAKLRQQQPSLLGQQRVADPTLGYR
jgi:uncharacterized protein YdaU (DUF1376 family)